MSPEAETLLETIRTAGTYESKAGDPQGVYVHELFAANAIRIAEVISHRSGRTLVYKVHNPDEPHPGVVHRKTTDSATPTIVPSGSTSGLIPPKITDDPRITKNRG